MCISTATHQRRLARPALAPWAMAIAVIFVNANLSGTSARGQSAACETDILKASDRQWNDRFGWSTSIAGDYAFFGATAAGFGPDNSIASTGSVYVYKRDGYFWTQQVELNASDAESFEFFGYSVSASGDLLLVGSRKGDKTVTEKTGAAYVYRREGEAWVEEFKLFAADASVEDFFGQSVSLHGDWAIVGAPGHDDNANASKTGAVYLYHREWDWVNTTWTWIQRARKLASDRNVDDQFGTSVATTGDWAIAGAPNNDDGCPGQVATCKSGSAYMIRRDPTSTAWAEFAMIVGEDTGELDRFGWSVAIDGDVAIVGAKDHPGTGVKTGAVYVFRYDGGDWIQEQKLVASDGATGDRFGHSVSLSGDNLVVGAYASDSPAVDAGAAYWFQYDGENWVETAKLTASDGRAGDWFGYSVATDGIAASIGAYKDDESRGAAYTFTISLGDDCNDNGIPDVCDIADGLATDVDGNGVLDQCECTEDMICADPHYCTQDTCNLTTSQCEHVVEEGWCVADNPDTGERFCVSEGAGNPFSDCSECNSALDPWGWSQMADGAACTDDDNDCTMDECVAGACHTPEVEGTACGDQSDSACDHPDTCDGAGLCQSHVDDEGTPCGDLVDTICDPLDTCDGAGECREFVADIETDCDDGFYCTGEDDSCDGLGSCQGIGDPCADRGLVCSEDNGGQCECDPDDDMCDDGVFCNGLETCNESTGACELGTNPCSESVPLCDEDNSRCVRCFVDADCDDGAYCNGEETCDVTNGVCVVGEAVNCDDGVACTDDACNETTRLCENVARNGNCNDGRFCTGEETCDAVFDCLGGDDPCPGQLCRESDDRCVECLADAECDDGLFCNGIEACDSNGECIFGDGDPCPPLGLICNENVDRCECDVGADCDDDNPCTDDQCADGECVIKPLPDCGACCLDDVDCIDGAAHAECNGIWDTFFEGQVCADVSCPASGACCFGGGCFEDLTEAFCEHLLRGVFAGSGADCGDCLYGACCVESVCVPGQQAQNCNAVDGEWAGPVTNCFDGVCPLCDDGNPDESDSVDLWDLAQLQNCFANEGIADCRCMDMDNDNDVDLDDYSRFLAAFSGP